MLARSSRWLARPLARGQFATAKRAGGERDGAMLQLKAAKWALTTDGRDAVKKSLKKAKAEMWCVLCEEWFDEAWRHTVADRPKDGHTKRVSQYTLHTMEALKVQKLAYARESPPPLTNCDLIQIHR